MKKWLCLIITLITCSAVVTGVQAEEPIGDILVCDMIGETMMTGISARDAADLDAILDKNALKSYVAAELEKRNTQIDISSYNIPRTDAYMEAVFNLIHVDLAEYFYAKATSLSYYSSGNTYAFINVEYTMTDAQYREKRIIWDAAVADILEGLNVSSMGDVEKALLIHDRIAEHCAYDYQNYLNGSIPAESYRAYGVLVNRRSVCQGYAETYQYLLNKVGIDSVLCDSDTLSHVWNIVEINGVDYHVDITWDDPIWDISGRINHTNFLCSSAEFAVSHEATDYNTAPSDTRYDNHFWRGSETAFQRLNGQIYYIDESSAMLKTYEGTELISVDDMWTAGGSSYWVGNFARLVSDGDYLYYNLSQSVYRYDVNSGTSEIIWTPEHSFGDGFSIYGMWYDDGYLYCELSTTPNFDTNTKTNYTLRYKLSEEEIHVHNYTVEAAEAKYLKTEATCTEAAEYYVSCSCGEAGTETFEYGEALGHEPGSAWEADETAHWHVCGRCEAEADKAEHIPDHEGGATEAYGIKCEICGWEMEAQLEHEHNYTVEAAEAKYLKTEATCTEAAEYYVSCSCGEAGTETFEYGEALGHEPGSAWEADETAHWHVCGRCEAEADKAEHIPDHEGGATEAYGIKCEICGWEMEAQLEHVHVWVDPEFFWAEDYTSCKAEFCCSGCEERYTEICTVTSEVIAESTADETGLIRYTAVCELNGKSWRDTVDVVIPVKGSVQLSVSDLEIKAGRTADVIVSIDSLPAEGLGALKLEITYDDTVLELVNAAGTDIIGNCTLSETIDQKPYIVLWDSIQKLETTGEILRLTFRAADKAEWTETADLLKIECTECIDLTLADIECTVGTFKTKLLIAGDLNGDGVVSGKDLILLRQYVAAIEGAVADIRVADVNGDGTISGKDVILMRQYVAGWDVTLQ
ncbi:MAG: hypothetical protein E7631_02300 [Ruminococcaceae bacterium]|nr:hypothetical protein [Oscillospiraceae bacterium]